MGTPLYNTDIIPMTSRPTLTVMDDGDYFVILDTSTGKISKILRTNIQKALNISYDNTTSGLTAGTVQAALDELVVNLGSSDSAILALAGRLDTLEGTGEGSVFKAIDDAVSPLAEVVDTNRLYSDSQYLALKAKADALQVKCNTLQAEVYTDDPILQYGAVEIIGDGYEADAKPIDVSANVVDGKLSMEQKGLTIRNIVNGANIANLGTVTFASILNDKYFDTLNVAILNGTGSDMTATNNSGATANMAIYHLNGLGLQSITDTAILSKLLPYVDGTKNVGKMGLQILDAEDEVTQTIFLPSIGNSLPNGVADSIKTVADGWEHTKRVGVGALGAEKVVNGDFSSVSETTWASWNNSTAGTSTVTNVDGKPRLYSPNGDFVAITQTNVLTIGKLYKLVVSSVISQGIIDLAEFGGGAISLSGIYTRYFIATSTSLRIKRLAVADFIINSCSVKEIATTAGTPLAISAQTQVYDDGTNGYYQLATPITTHYDLLLPTSGKTIHRFAGEEKIALYGTGLTFSENVLTVLSAIKFVAGVMTDITSLATITTNTVTFSGVSATDVVYVKVEHDVDRPLGILEHTPAVSNTASRLASLEARVTALEV